MGLTIEYSEELTEGLQNAVEHLGAADPAELIAVSLIGYLHNLMGNSPQYPLNEQLTPDFFFDAPVDVQLHYTLFLFDAWSRAKLGEEGYSLGIYAEAV